MYSGVFFSYLLVADCHGTRHHEQFITALQIPARAFGFREGKKKEGTATWRATFDKTQSPRLRKVGQAVGL